MGGWIWNWKHPDTGLQVICRRHVLNLPPGLGKMMMSFSARYVVGDENWEQTKLAQLQDYIVGQCPSCLTQMATSHFPSMCSCEVFLNNLGSQFLIIEAPTSNSSQCNFSYFMFCVKKKKILFLLKISIIIRLKYLDQMQPSQCWRNSPTPQLP